MDEDVLTDSLLDNFSKHFDVSQYSASEFSTDLGFDAAAGHSAERTANIEKNPQQAYRILLGQFVQENGRGKESAEKLIDILETNRKKLLADTLKKEIAEQALKRREDSRQQPAHPDREKDMKSAWIAGLIGFVVVILAIFIFAIRSGSNMCASSPCQNGGTCNDLDDAYSCTCSTGFGGIDCETEYITETLTVQECQQLLREYYEVHLFKIPIKPWDPDDFVDLEDYFTTVSLYKEDKNNIADKPLQKITLNGSVNDIFQTKIRRSLPKRIVLFGEAGRGKTTAVAKMAYDWATKKKDSPLKDVKLLFVFKTRNMNEQTGIAEAVIQLLGKKFRKYETNLEEYIDSHEKDIVILFDGYDEFTGGLQSSGNTSDIIDILRNDRCKQCRVLVTSRPTKRTDFNYIYSKMVIEGYSQQHTTDFIDKFFLSNKAKGIELKNYLKEDIVANEMIATPLFCTMVCYLWNEGYDHGIFTRTKLFDGIMHFLRTHLNAKDEGNEKIGESLVIDTVISVGKVAFKKLNNTKDTCMNPLLFREDDFREIHGEKVNISFSLGLLTKSVKTDRDFDIYIEFFHKLAQEYAAAKYLATNLDEGRFSRILLLEIALDMEEVLQFASGTSDSACLEILASIIDHCSHSGIAHKDNLYSPLILDFLSESETCAEQSKTHLKRFLKYGKLELRRVTASTVVGFERLPGSVKEKITTIDISGWYSSPGLFVRLWNNLRTCFNLIHMKMRRHAPKISPDMKKLYSVNSLSTILEPPADNYVHILTYLPNLQELVIYRFDSHDCLEVALTSDVFQGLWNQLNSSQSLLSRLTLPIPVNIGITSSLKQLRSVRVFETDNVFSLRSFAHVLTFLPQIKELIVNEIKIPEMDDNTAAFCELWENLHTSPQLKRLLLPLPANIGQRCNLRPLWSVQVFETQYFSTVILDILRILPNLHELIVLANGYNSTTFCELWENLHTSPQLKSLLLPLPPETGRRYNLRPLLSVQVFETKSSSPVILDILRSLPNLHKLILHSDIPEINFISHGFFEKFWRILHDYHELHHLKVNIPNSVPALHMESLQSVKIFETKIKSQRKAFSQLLSLLPNVAELDIFASNTYDRKVSENVYYDEVLSFIIDGLVTNNIQLEVLRLTFNPRSNASNTVSHNTVHNFIQMLKSSGRVKQLEITSFKYCVFNESDLIEIVTAIRALTSVVLLSLDCNIDSEGKLSQYAIQYNQSTEQNPKLNVESRKRRHLKLTLIYRDQQTNARQERNFVLPPLDWI